MEVNSITAEENRERLRKCKESGATGLDAWAPRDFKKLPDQFLEYLRVSHDMVERLGEWPYAVTHVAVTLIPKNEGFDPLCLRPISVLPIAYRLWAAVRCRHCASWQENLITSGQHGCRQGHSTSVALLRLAAELENASLTGNPIFGAALEPSTQPTGKCRCPLSCLLLKKLSAHRHAELCTRHKDPWQESGVVENSVPYVGALSSSYCSEAERY